MIPRDPPRDLWESASAYERFMGRWSRELARHFVRWLAVPPGRHWLEVGCGTGALTKAILAVGSPASVVATDASEPFVKHAQAMLSDDRVEFLAAPADSLPTRGAGYDVVISSLVLNFIPDPPAALRAMRSVAADYGVVTACVWDYGGGMEFLRWFWDAAVELDPAARQYDEGERFPVCSPSGLEAAFQEAGFSRTIVQALEIATHFADFDDYWSPFIGGPGPAPGYLSSLSSQRKEDLANRVAEILPRDKDGSIALRAKAWVARSQVERAA